GTVLQDGLVHFFLATVLIYLLLLRGRPLERRFVILVLPALAWNLLPAILTVPRQEYDLGWRASWILLEIVGGCWLLANLTRWALAPGSVEQASARLRKRALPSLRLEGSSRWALAGA